MSLNTDNDWTQPPPRKARTPGVPASPTDYDWTSTEDEDEAVRVSRQNEAATDYNWANPAETRPPPAEVSTSGAPLAATSSDWTKTTPATSSATKLPKAATDFDWTVHGEPDGLRPAPVLSGEVPAEIAANVQAFETLRTPVGTMAYGNKHQVLFKAEDGTTTIEDVSKESYDEHRKTVQSSIKKKHPGVNPESQFVIAEQPSQNPENLLPVTSKRNQMRAWYNQLASTNAIDAIATLNDLNSQIMQLVGVEGMESELLDLYEQAETLDKAITAVGYGDYISRNKKAALEVGDMDNAEFYEMADFKSLGRKMAMANMPPAAMMSKVNPATWMRDTNMDRDDANVLVETIRNPGFANKNLRAAVLHSVSLQTTPELREAAYQQGQQVLKFVDSLNPSDDSELDTAAKVSMARGLMAMTEKFAAEHAGGDVVNTFKAVYDMFDGAVAEGTEKVPTDLVRKASMVTDQLLMVTENPMQVKDVLTMVSPTTLTAKGSSLAASLGAAADTFAKIDAYAPSKEGRDLMRTFALGQAGLIDTETEAYRKAATYHNNALELMRNPTDGRAIGLAYGTDAKKIEDGFVAQLIAEGAVNPEDSDLVTRNIAILADEKRISIGTQRLDKAAPLAMFTGRNGRQAANAAAAWESLNKSISIGTQEASRLSLQDRLAPDAPDPTVAALMAKEKLARFDGNFTGMFGSTPVDFGTAREVSYSAVSAAVRGRFTRRDAAESMWVSDSVLGIPYRSFMSLEEFKSSGLSEVGTASKDAMIPIKEYMLRGVEHGIISLDDRGDPQLVSGAQSWQTVADKSRIPVKVTLGSGETVELNVNGMDAIEVAAAKYVIANAGSPAWNAANFNDLKQQSEKNARDDMKNTEDLRGAYQYLNENPKITETKAYKTVTSDRTNDIMAMEAVSPTLAAAANSRRAEAITNRKEARKEQLRTQREAYLAQLKADLELRNDERITQLRALLKSSEDDNDIDIKKARVLASLRPDSDVSVRELKEIMGID